MRTAEAHGHDMTETPTSFRWYHGSLGLVASCLVLIATQRAEAAGGAFQVDDAEIGKPGSCKVESWVSYADNRDFIGTISPACVFEIGRAVELTTQYFRFRSDGDWGTGLILKGKTNILPVETGKLGLGLIGGTALDLLTGDASAVFATVPATYQFSEQLKLNLNAGWLWDRVADRHLFSWGAGVEWMPVDKVTLITEVFGFVGGDNNDPRFQTGIRFTPVPALDIDVIYGRNLTGERANWITLGLNVRFDPALPK